MSCPHCGKPLEHDDTYCYDCAHPWACECTTQYIDEHGNVKYGYRKPGEWDALDEFWSAEEENLERVEVIKSGQKSDVSDLTKHNIRALYYITSIDNLQGIFALGILSHRQAHDCGFIRHDISDSDVQYLRGKKAVDGRPLHHFACLYFNPKNPMLSRRRDQNDDLAILVVSPSVLLDPYTVFTDGNAASHETKYYTGTQFLSRLNWEIINAKYWTDYPDGKRIRCAEILVMNEISPDKITLAIFHSRPAMEKCRQVIKDNKISFKIMPESFF